MTKLPISVTILTKNSQKYLIEVLNALQDFDEILICDTGSTDETVDLVQQFPNVTLYQRPFTGFGPTHNLASSLARHPWILSIDSDEVVTPTLAQEIKGLALNTRTVYALPRHNEYKGVWIKWCGWHPDYQVRLYHRNTTRFTNAHVHEAIITHGLHVQRLHNPLVHYSYENVADFLSKMQAYSDLFAKQYQGIKSSSPCKAVLHACFAFFKSYFLKKGFLGGSVGFEISVYNANTAFYKYLKLAEANQLLAAAKSCDAPRKKQDAVTPLCSSTQNQL